MDSIIIEKQDDVAVLRLNNGVTNALSLEFVTEISKNLQNLKNDPSVRSLVITSGNNKFFCIGFDLPHLVELDREGVKTFYQAYNSLCLDLYTFPRPTIAAITGHATAGGCILSLCCDFRFIVQGRKLMGLNEIKLGLPVPYPGDMILKQIVGIRNARTIMEVGEFYASQELMQMGMVDQIYLQDSVEGESKEQARLLGKFPSHGFEMIKTNRVERVKLKILKKLKVKEDYFLECWFKDETQKLLKAATERF